MPKFRKLFQSKKFVLYSVGQAFSQFGDRLVQIVLIGFIAKRFPGSTFQLAKVFFFTVMPAFFISPIAGVYVDRWDKRYIMIASDISRGLAILLIPLFFLYADSIVPIYVIIFFVFVFACFFLPARFSIIPSLVPKEDLLLANSASSITWVASGIIGFSFGGILNEWIGVKNSMYANSLVYFLSAMSFCLLLLSMKGREKLLSKDTRRQPLRNIIDKSFINDLKEGLKTLLFDKKIRFIAFIFFILSSMVGGIYLVAVVFIQETLGSITKHVGLISMYLFAGTLIGSYIYGKIGQKLPRTKTIFLSLVLCGIFIDLFAIGLKTTKLFWPGGASAFLLGFFISPIYVTANTVIHESTESNLRGRIFSSMGIIMNLGFLIFMLLSSMLAEYIERFWMLIVCGSGFSVFGIVCLLAGSSRDITFSSS